MRTVLDTSEQPVEPISVSVETALQITGLGRTKLWSMISSGRVKSGKIDGRRVILYSSLKELVAEAMGSEAA